MRRLDEFSLESRADIGFLLFDIDETLTTHGQLTAEAYAALGRAKAAGLVLIPVTGRPAGWCDHIARMWPVDAVVGENGAFYFRFDREARKLKQRFVADADARAAHRSQLAAIGERILAAVPGCALASDQRYREADLAIDFCEDVPPLPRDAVHRIKALMEAAGLTAKVSSIHVNGWFGDFDKLSTTRLYFREALAMELDDVRGRCVFAGDSPNDQPMFAYFPHAVGVANVARMQDLFTTLPAYVTARESGAGFVELVDALLAAR